MTRSIRTTTRSRRLCVAGAATLALAAGSALAQDSSIGRDAQAPGVPPEASNSRDAALQVQQQGDATYVNGGIGDEGKARAIALGRDMNLQLVFAQAPRGEYLADVEVAIAHADGDRVLSLDSADPLLFAQLPPGRYEVTASVDGRMQTRRIEVPAQGRETAYFHWRAGY